MVEGGTEEAEAVRIRGVSNDRAKWIDDKSLWDHEGESNIVTALSNIFSFIIKKTINNQLLESYHWSGKFLVLPPLV